MRLRVEVDGKVAARLRDVGRELVTGELRELVVEALRNTLRQVIQENPVETGRSRAAWVQCLELLGGAAPAGWQGSDGIAMAEGKSRGSVSRGGSGQQVEVTATNAVTYVPWLEYGTRRLRPAAMVRKSLARVARRLRRSW